MLKLLTGKYEIITVDDCERVGEQYATDMMSMAEQFWNLFPSPESILAKLAKVPGEARECTGTDFFAATRAIVLTRMLRGEAESRQFANGVLMRLSGEAKLELSQWMMRAFDVWSAT